MYVLHLISYILRDIDNILYVAVASYHVYTSGSAAVSAVAVVRARQRWALIRNWFIGGSRLKYRSRH